MLRTIWKITIDDDGLYESIFGAILVTILGAKTLEILKASMGSPEASYIHFPIFQYQSSGVLMQRVP